MSAHPPSDIRSVTTSDPRTERTRQSVIEAGKQAFVEHGPDGVNHAAIAAAAGVSRTTIYKYWPTRTKLLLDTLVAFDAHPQLGSSGDIRSDLVRMLGGLQASMSDPTRRRVFSSMLAQAQWDEDVSEAKDRLRAIPLGGLAALLDAAVDRGEIIEGVSPSGAAGRLVGPLMFAALIADDMETIDIESIVDDWFATVQR